MNPELLLTNLAHYSWQLVALIAVGLGLPVAFRIREPRSHLIYLQLLLTAALLLPALQPWAAPTRLTFSTARFSQLAPSTGIVTDTIAWSWQEYAVIALVAGTAMRLGWLALGLTMLRRYRSDARPIELAAIDHARQATQSTARVCQSATIPGPATFGFWRPLVLLPPAVAALPEEAQFAVVAHEFLHVRRGDWLYAVAEELIVAALWWHPAIWFLVARIRLVREQVIDRAVVELTASPQPYIHALLTLAKQHSPPSLAPNFLRRQHLTTRIRILLTEVNMSHTRLVATYTVITALASATAWLSVTNFPLQAAPQFGQSDSRVTGAEVVLRKNPVYPSLAKQKRIEGTVEIEVTIAENGSAEDARVLSGPQELRRAALEAVLQWQFKQGNPRAVVRIDFSLTPDGAPAPKGKPAAINITDAAPAVVETLRARLAHLEGQPLNALEISEIVRSVAPSLGISFQTNPATNDVTLTVGNPSASFAKGDGPRIRVGGNVQSAKLVTKVTPLYPPLAKQTRIQGTVRFNSLIGADGHVRELLLETGHPLLVESAMTAVRQWIYQPTLLNGNAVEVVTSIDVNYTLTQ